MKRAVLILALLTSVLAIAAWADEGEVKVKGAIQNFSTSHITVQDTTFAIDSSTRFEDGSASDMAVGVMVEVEGREKSGVLTAKKIEFDDEGGEDEGGGHHGGDDDGEEVEVEGMVTAVAGDTFSVGGMDFNITPKTHFIRMTRSDLVVGLEVEVKGEQNNGGGNDAISVKREGNNGGDRGATAVVGVLASVQSLGGELLELTLEDGTMMVVDEDTSVSGRHGLKSTAEDLIPGLTLRLQFKKSATVAEGDRREATHINVLGELTVKGVIPGVILSSVEGSIMVGDEEVKYDNRTVVQGDTDAESPDEIPGGEFVVALCNPLEDGSFLGNRIIVTDDDGEDDDDGDDDGNGELLGRRVRFFGTISAVSVGSGFSIGEQFFAIGDNTSFKVKSCDEPFDADLLEEGLSVKVIAVQDGDGGLIAAKVIIFLPMFKFSGPLDSISADMLSILGVDVAITEFTDFEGVTPGELGPGDVVEVKAVQWPDDTLIACEVEAEDEEDDDDDSFTIMGVISDKTVDGDNVLITVGEVVIVVEPDTDIRSKNMTLTPDDLAIGENVQINGSVNGDGDLIARHVKVR